MYKIEWQPKAVRRLRKIREHKTRLMIFNAADKLQNWPDCRNVKALQPPRADIDCVWETGESFLM
jgi:mRNA-degrading endonuclease RelE of RelBE toxin-antitoxin system